jgi:hypothetical protein
MAGRSGSPLAQAVDAGLLDGTLSVLLELLLGLLLANPIQPGLSCSSGSLEPLLLLLLTLEQLNARRALAVADRFFELFGRLSLLARA